MMAVRPYGTVSRPSTLVLHIRRMCWKFCDWKSTDIFGLAFCGLEMTLPAELNGALGVLSKCYSLVNKLIRKLRRFDDGVPETKVFLSTKCDVRRNTH